jgi:hypothetical protein
MKVQWQVMRMKVLFGKALRQWSEPLGLDHRTLKN